MRPWAQWTAKTALVAAGFAAAGGGLSGATYAGTGGIVPSASASVLSTSNVDAPVSLSADVCGIAGALLGIASADCQGGAVTVTLIPGGVVQGAAGSGTLGTLIGSGNTASTPVSVPADNCGNTGEPGGSAASCAGGAGSSTTIGSPVRTVTEHVAAPLASAPGADGPPAGVGPVSSPTSLSGLTGKSSQGLSAAGGTSGPGSGALPLPGAGRTFTASSGASSGTGSSRMPSASQLAGLGTLPGLADLPSLAGLANLPALHGGNMTAVPMPGTTLSAADAAGMSGHSYAALAVGSLLAGAAALQIAGRRARDRKAGIGVAI